MTESAWIDPETGEVVPRTFENFRSGRIPLTDLDDEELTRLQVRADDGTFRGGQPKSVPREMARAHAQELVARNDKLMKETVLKATAVFNSVIDDPRASHGDKMRAAQYLHDRVLGKTPDKVEVSAEIKPWEKMVVEAVESD